MITQLNAILLLGCWCLMGVTWVKCCVRDGRLETDYDRCLGPIVRDGRRVSPEADV